MERYWAEQVLIQREWFLRTVLHTTVDGFLLHGFAEEEPARFYVGLNSDASNGAVVLEHWNSGRE